MEDESINIPITIEADYWERAVAVLREKVEDHEVVIENQRRELARLGNIHKRDIKKTGVWQAGGFLIQVIIEKIKKLWLSLT